MVFSLSITTRAYFNEVEFVHDHFERVLFPSQPVLILTDYFIENTNSGFNLFPSSKRSDFNEDKLILIRDLIKNNFHPPRGLILTFKEFV